MPQSANHRAASREGREVGWGNVSQILMMHLLKERPTFASVRDLSRKLGLGHSKVAEVVNFLEFHHAVRDTEGGVRIEWDQLARIMGALRLPIIVPARSLDLVATQSEFHDLLHDEQISHVFGFTTAANALAYFEPHPETCLFVEKPDVPKVAKILARVNNDAPPQRARLSAGGLRSRPRALIFADRLDRLDVVDTKLGTVTSLHQTYVDLLHFPLAGAHADFLKKAIEKRWARDHPEKASSRTRTT